MHTNKPLPEFLALPNQRMHEQKSPALMSFGIRVLRFFS
jgi:hypothetical protein